MEGSARKLDKEKRRALFDAAVDEFATWGVEGASYNRIIERSGLSKGVVYYYVENKERLFEAVLDELGQIFLDAVGHFDLPRSVGDFWPACRAYYGKLLRFTAVNRKIVGVFHQLGKPGSGGPVYERLSASQKRVERCLERVLRRGQAYGVVRTDIPPDLLRELVQGIGHTMGSRFFRAMEERELETEELEHFQDTALDVARRVLSPEEVR